MTQYLKPEREELEYRKKLLGSSCSMSWNHGTISFPEEEWDHYLDQYVNSDGSSALGRFIYCDHCGYAIYSTDEAFEIEGNGDIIHKDCWCEYAEEHMLDFVRKASFSAAY